MSSVRRQPPSGNAVGRLLQSAWRYKGLIAAVVLLGALFGYGWAARQPVLYQGVARVLLATPGSTSLPGEAPPPPVEPAQYLRQQAQLMRSAPVLERAVKLSGSSISAETLDQRLEVEAAQDADVLTVRVVDSTATGAARLVDAVTAAYDEVLGQQWRASSMSQLQNTRSRWQARLAEMDAELARNPADPALRVKREAVADQLSAIARQLMKPERNRPPLYRERAGVPKQPISPSPGRAMAIGILLGLLASAVLVWWRTRRQGPPSGASASEQGPEMPSPA